MESKKFNKKAIFLAILSGLLLTVAFPRIQQGWIAWFALLPLLIALRNQKMGAGFKLGLLCGLTHYMSLCYWLMYTMHTYGQLALYLSVPVFFLACAYLALYPAVFAAALTALRPQGVWRWVTVPALWVTLEYARAHLLLAFPWELLGYSQTPYLHMAQLADITGVYGLSFLIAAGNTALLRVWLYKRGLDWRGKSTTGKQAAIALTIVVGLVAATLIYGDWRMNGIDRQMHQADHANMAVVQGNIDQAVKWSPHFQAATVETYLRLSAEITPKQPDLIVWPETAAPFYFTYRQRLTQMVLNGIKGIGTDFLIGSPTVSRLDGTVQYYNSAYLIDRSGTIAARYDKYRLVPFGEYVPCKQWLPFIGKMVEQVGDFKAGARGRVLDWRNHQLGVQICYEIIFPNLAGRLSANGADVLVNITNDAWYGRSSAPYQHFSMSRMRAIENRRTVVRAANTGISGMIDPVGRVLTQSPLYEATALNADVPILDELSIYSQWGDWLPIGCTVVTAISLLAAGYRQHRRRRSKAA